MGGQHSQKVAVKKTKKSVTLRPNTTDGDTFIIAGDKGYVYREPRAKKVPVVPVNPLAGERRPRIKTKMKFKRWV